ncbi:phage integrase N-terminal SAM-like domain-containing protein [Sorangium sp. So ce590]|uniref:phage integrase N-terminal SAM-like domain-containing protein n=1 Tax=Sorangium sp. So ce590 TaxID=3133317 RepID=UPI003F60B823
MYLMRSLACCQPMSAPGTLVLARRCSVAARSTETTMVTLTTWRGRMSEDMRLRDFRPRTQEGYLLSVRPFIDRVAREPEALTDEDEGCPVRSKGHVRA